MRFLFIQGDHSCSAPSVWQRLREVVHALHCCEYQTDLLSIHKPWTKEKKQTNKNTLQPKCLKIPPSRTHSLDQLEEKQTLSHEELLSVNKRNSLNVADGKLQLSACQIRSEFRRCDIQTFATLSCDSASDKKQLSHSTNVTTCLFFLSIWMHAERWSLLLCCFIAITMSGSIKKKKKKKRSRY